MTARGDGHAGAEQPVAAGSAPGDLDATALADRIAAIASDRKAIDIRIVDVRELVSYTDYLVICSGNSERQTNAIRDAVQQQLKDDHGLLPRRTEGNAEARWILLDYLDCVVHVFTPDARSFYRLDKLWGDAPQRAVE